MTQLASYTIFRTVVAKIADATERVFKENQRLGQSDQAEEYWTVLLRYSTERLVCKYLFDESYRRNGRKCWGVRVLFLDFRLEMNLSLSAAVLVANPSISDKVMRWV